MPTIIHSFKKEKIMKITKEDNSFILSNKKGGYCHLATKPTSRYQGLFFNDNFKMYKVIDQIELKGDITEIKNNFYNIQRKRKNLIETFFVPYNHDSLIYELNREKEIELILDIRESYKSPELGRCYKIKEENNKLIVKYSQENEFECYIVISGYSNFNKIEKWFNQNYELDKQRNSLPYEKYVFSALKLRSKKIIISFSKDKDKAVKENEFISNNLDLLKKKQKEYIENLFKKVKIKNINRRFAYYCALKQLDDLTVTINNKEGIYAGLPWFFQFWSRDELISLKALLLMKKYYKVKKIIARITDNISKNGLTNKFTGDDTKSADSIGWLCKRLEDLNTESKKHLIEKDIKKIIKKLESFVDYYVHKKKKKDGFIVNNEKETWMDSLDRNGIRVEIQALWLTIFRLLYDLTKKEKYKIYEYRLKKNIIKKLWNNKYFADGLDDWTIRPNIFIAAYVYPKLLNKAQWTRCFERIMPKLWLSYGGLSTVDKNNESFHKAHTGENNLSYHNGDSWFYINNMAALVLHRTDKKKFKKYIDCILKTSTEEILWKGSIGCSAELSSANKLKSQGCLSQAWSSAMFIELINLTVSFS